MKNKLLFPALLMCSTVLAQNYPEGQPIPDQLIPTQTRVLLPALNDYTGLITYSYLEVKGEADPVTVNKPLYIIYNSKFCKLSIGGLITNFDIDPSYKRELVNGDVVESFLNAETNTIRRGWYDIVIAHNKAGTSAITINLPMYPEGHTYFVTKAKIYSEYGQVKGKTHVENWKDLEEKQKMAEMKKLPFGGAKPTVNIDSFVTACMYNKFQIKRSESIGDFTVSLFIDTIGKVTASDFKWGEHHTSLGFTTDQGTSEPADKYGNTFYWTPPLNEKQYGEQILLILNTLPNFKPGVGSITCDASFHIGSKD